MDIETRLTKLEQEVQSLRIENLYLREVVNNKIKVIEETTHKELLTYKTEINNMQDKPDPLCGQILIGSKQIYSGHVSDYDIPIFCNTNCDYNMLVQISRSPYNNTHFGSVLRLETLKQINLDRFDICQMASITITYNNKIIYNNGGRADALPDIASTKGIKTIYKFCKDNNIKFLWNGQTQLNGIDIEHIVNSNTTVENEPGITTPTINRRDRC